MSTIASMLILEDRMSRTLNTIDRAAQNANSTFHALTAQINNLTVQMNNIQRTNLTQLTNNINNVNNASRQLANNTTQANNTLQNMIGTVGKLGLAFGGLAGIKSLIGLSDETTGIRARLNLLVDSNAGETLEDLEKQVFDSANRIGTQYSQVADIVGRVGNQARDAFGNNEEIVAFAELLEKTFSNAGSDATAISSTMYNLTQSLSSGKLLGNDYRILKQNAPQMIQYLRDFYGVTAEGLDKMVTAGQVTASDIKNAMFNAAEDINTTFNNMPISWENAMARIRNHALKAFEPILRKINEIVNNEGLTNFTSKVVSGLYTIGNIANSVFTGLVNLTSFIANNWSIIGPIIGGIVAQMLLYKGTLLAIKAIETARNIINGISIAISNIQRRAVLYQSVAHMGLAQSIVAATGAQLGLNAAMLANPVFLIIAGIIALIGIIFIVVGVINKVTGQSISAIGVITGALATAGAFIFNLVLGIVDIFLGAINMILNPWLTFANFFGNIFNDPIASIIHLFGDMANSILGILNSIANAIDKVFGSNLASAVEGWRSNLNKWVEDKANKYGNGTYEKVVESLNLSSESLGLKRINYGDAYNAGYDFGKNLSSMFNNLNVNDLTGTSNEIDYSKYINDSLNKAMGTDSNGGKAVKTTSDDKLLSEEDIQLLLDVATRDYKLNYQQVTPQITVTFGDIRETADVDNILDQVADRLEEIYDGNLEVATV